MPTYAEPSEQKASTSPATAPEGNKAPQTVDKLLADAKVVLQYAIESGVELDPNVINIIATSVLQKPDRTIIDEAAILNAVVKLTSSTIPVTAASIRAVQDKSDGIVGRYLTIAVVIAAILVPLSVVFFVINGLSKALDADISSNNELAVAISTKLGPAQPAAFDQIATAALLTDLQKLASTTRATYGRARILSWFFPVVDDPVPEFLEANGQTLELPSDMSKKAGKDDFSGVFQEKITQYQVIRYFASQIEDATSFVVGAVTAFVLPVLYALLGACASSLRALASQIRAKTFVRSAINTESMIVAGIGGMVVGLFTNFSLPQTVSLSPLAIAFLVGYASDTFFSFVDGLLQRASSTPPK